MKVLNKKDKKIYNELLGMVKFRNLECWDLKTPEGWINNIRNIKIRDFK
jgi:hypothetical protein|tara:strand:+ start:4729 stop:4875 length:147 start_codon:yes stop_codon:yes gene_type:complete